MREFHLSDQELIRDMDGESSAHERAHIQSHLSACWICRTRSQELENALMIFANEYENDLPLRLPSQPHGAAGQRALLKAQLAQIAANPKTSVLQRWFSSRWFSFRDWPDVAVYAAAAVVLVAIVTAGISVAALHLHSPIASNGIASNGFAPNSFASNGFAAAYGRAPSAVPVSNLTPGAVRVVSVQDLCGSQNSGQGSNVRFIAAVRNEVFRQYGMPDAKPEAYEVDYLITPELGGADDVRNLWPEPYEATAWNARVKDQLEDKLHDMVCAGQVDLATAQSAIATDWIAAYKKYFQTDRPLPNEPAGIERRDN